MENSWRRGTGVMSRVRAEVSLPEFRSPKCKPAKSGLCVWLLVFGLALVMSGTPRNSSALQDVSGADRPNIVLINLDDADWSLFDHDFRPGGNARRFPNIARLADEGMRFTNFHVTIPLCGPSRACLLTGQYAHRTGVRCNDPGTGDSRGMPGGYDHWRDAGPEGATGPTWENNNLAVWMHDAGYRTMMVGKYLHSGLQPRLGEEWSDMQLPGWDDLYATFGSNYYFSGQLVNGSVRYLHRLDRDRYPSDYRTDIEAADAQLLVRAHRAAQPEQPFFLYFAPLTPHREAPWALNPEEDQPGRGMVPARYRGHWAELFQEIEPDFNEWDVSDKPAQVAGLPPLNLSGSTWRENDFLLADTEFRRRSLAMRAVDDFVGELLQTLEELNIDDNTIVMLTSDNGYLLGQQRMFAKGVCLDRCTRVPLLVWGPGHVVNRDGGLGYLLAHVDLAPTILDFAGIELPVQFAGKSFVPLLKSQFSGLYRDWRPEGVLLEHYQNKVEGGHLIQSTVCGIRQFNSVYLEWANGESEYYNLHLDPFQLDNLASQLSVAQRSELRSLIGLHKADMAAPDSFIERPAGAFETAYQAAVISGTAENALAVREVRLAIRDVTSQPARYWNGENWQTDHISVSASLDAPGLTLVNWSYSFAPPVEELAHRYTITSRAYGDNGQFQPVPDVATLSLSPVHPYGQVQDPGHNEVVYKSSWYPLVISGWASDPDGMRLVRLVLRHEATGLFWNGTNWQEGATTLPVSMQFRQSGKLIQWSYEFDAPETDGSVVAIVRMLSADLNKPVQTERTRFGWSD